MPDADFQHIRVSMVKDVAVVEIRTKEVHGIKLAQELAPSGPGDRPGMGQAAPGQLSPG